MDAEFQRHLVPAFCLTRDPISFQITNTQSRNGASKADSAPLSARPEENYSPLRPARLSSRPAAVLPESCATVWRHFVFPAGAAAGVFSESPGLYQGRSGNQSPGFHERTRPAAS